MSRAASREAVAHFQRAIAQLLSLPDTSSATAARHRCRTLLAARWPMSPASPPKRSCRSMPGPATFASRPAIPGPSSSPNGTSGMSILPAPNTGMLKRLAERLMAAAERENDPDLLLQARHVEWVALGTTARLPGGPGQLRARLGALRPGAARLAPSHLRRPRSGRLQSQSWRARRLWCLGQPDRARACYEQGLALARRLNHPLIVVHALARGLPLFQLLPRPRPSRGPSNRTFELAAEQGFPNYRLDAEILRAWATRDRTEPGSTTRLIEAPLPDGSGSSRCGSTPISCRCWRASRRARGRSAAPWPRSSKRWSEAQTKGHLRHDQTCCA